MRVYHFCSKEHALSNIRNSRIKIARINELNDPFEFYVNFTESGKLLDDADLVKIKEHYNKILGIICFSKQLGSPVQWAHYADNHKGICLEFEVPKKLLVKVKYKSKPVNVDSDDGNWKLQFVKATKTKYRHWRYEKERRLIVPLKSSGIAEENNLLFMPFSDDLSPIRAHVGLECELAATEKSDLVKNRIDVMGTIKSRNSYLIENA